MSRTINVTLSDACTDVLVYLAGRPPEVQGTTWHAIRDAVAPPDATEASTTTLNAIQARRDGRRPRRARREHVMTAPEQVIDPPFYRGEKGEWDATICDRLLPSGDACDQPAEYLIEWVATLDEPAPALPPVSGACRDHGSDAPRVVVLVMQTHPSAVGRGES